MSSGDSLCFHIDLELSKPLPWRVRLQSGSTRLGIRGRSGCGKTTLLMALCGLRRAQGDVILGGRVLQRRRTRTWVPIRQRRMGVVFQEGRLFPHLSVLQNVCFAMPRQSSMLDEVMERLGLGELLGRRITNLSGGEARRVAIARAILCEPDYLLLDEPFVGLDTAMVGRVSALLAWASDTLGCPLLVVSHDAALDDLVEHTVAFSTTGVLTHIQAQKSQRSMPRLPFWHRVGLEP